MGMDWQLDGLNRPPPGVDDVWHLATNGKTLVQPNCCNSPLAEMLKKATLTIF